MSGRALWGMVLLLVCATSGAAPTPSVAGVPGLVSIRLQRLDFNDGLSQASARALAQDGEGMIWIGTQDGLNRYDGEQMRVFRRDQQDPDSLTDNHVTALAVDRDGQLWVGTQSGGLGRYDADALRFRNFPVGLGRPDALAAVPVHAIEQAADGQFLIASGRGNLQRFDPKSARFKTIVVPENVQVRALLALPGGDVLVGGTHGLWRWRVADGALQEWATGISSERLDVQSLARDAQSNVWIGSVAHGAFHVDENGLPLRHLDLSDGLAGDDVRALLIDQTARVWVGTYTGLSRIDAPGAAPRSWTRDDTRRDGLSSDRVHSLIEDRDGLIWIGTWLGGVNVYLPGSEAFREYRSVAGEPGSLPGSAVRCIFPDTDGTLWLGVQEGGGLVHFDPARGVLQRFRSLSDDPTSLASDRVQAIARDADGDLWVGFVDGGLDRLRRGATGFEHLRASDADPSAPQGDNVLALHVDRAGTLWVGYQDVGMDALCRGCSKFRRFRHVPGDPNGLPEQTIGAVFESSRGELWVGARPGGLARLDRASGRFTSIEALLVSPGVVALRAITHIIESRAGELWVGTQGAGVVRLTPLPDGRFRSTAYTHKEGLAGEAIGSIIEDLHGTMWAATTQGISRIDPDSGKIENFSTRSGAQTEGYFVGAGVRLDDGRIVFGGLRGLTLFQPEQVPARGVLHRPAISDIRVFQSRRDRRDSGWSYRRSATAESDWLRLRAGSGGFGFSFSALAFADPELVQYSYRLDPIDRDWTEASASQRNAGYPHLAPGDYQLRLRTRYPGEDYSPERRIAVTLDPLWWQSAWARGALALALVGPLMLWGWNRHQRLRERSRAQAVLSESEERLKLALWGTGDEFWDADMRSGNLVRVNPLGHLRITQEVPEISLRQLVQYVHLEDQAVFTQALQVHASGDNVDFDCVYRLQHGDSSWRWMRSRGRTVKRDANDRPLRMAGVTEDITELREYERTLERVNQQLEERVGERTADLMMLNGQLVKTIDELKLTQHQLVESEKLAALGSLVAGIAHEVNTPLGVGVTAASHLEQQAKQFAQRIDAGDIERSEIEAFRTVVLDTSAMVLRNLQRADKMIRSFKQVAVDQASEHPRRIDLNAYLEEILVSLQPALKRCKHELKIDVPPHLVVLIQPGALYQIVVNLVMNSLTHAFEGRDDGEIRIHARRQGETLVFDYSDDGCGMSEDIRRHIFDPFFTTRRGQGGSGLGMHIVYNLAVQALGGSIECETAPGQGARFVLRIPLRETMPSEPVRA